MKLNHFVGLLFFSLIALSILPNPSLLRAAGANFDIELLTASQTSYIKPSQIKLWARIKNTGDIVFDTNKVEAYFWLIYPDGTFHIQTTSPPSNNIPISIGGVYVFECPWDSSDLPIGTYGIKVRVLEKIAFTEKTSIVNNNFILTNPTQYTLAVSISGQGGVTKSPDQSTYASGTVVQLTATPSTGYIFTGWSGDLTGTTNPVSITMNSNKAVTATFTFDNNQLSLWGEIKTWFNEHGLIVSTITAIIVLIVGPGILWRLYHKKT